MDRILKTLLLLVALAAVVSCAKEPEDDTYDVQGDILKAWIEINYPDKLNQKTENGAYILSLQQGTGKTVSDSGYVFVHYVRRDLAGNITDTNMAKYADQLGSYTIGNDYGCDIWQVGVEAIYVGLEDVLKTLKVGGHALIGMPAAAAVCEYDAYDAFPGDENVSYILEIYLEQVEDDIYAYQEKALKAYSDKYYGGMDTVGQGFYYIDQTDPTAETDTIADGESVNVWYIGRRLDGSVFDTNIQDTAKKYRLYTSDGEYEALEVTWYEDAAEIVDEGDVVSGFALALNKMDYGSTATTFFWSTLGYGAGGSSPKIGEYCPMVFTLTIEEKED